MKELLSAILLAVLGLFTGVFDQLFSGLQELGLVTLAVPLFCGIRNARAAYMTDGDDEDEEEEDEDEDEDA